MFENSDVAAVVLLSCVAFPVNDQSPFPPRGEKVANRPDEGFRKWQRPKTAPDPVSVSQIFCPRTESRRGESASDLYIRRHLSLQSRTGLDCRDQSFSHLFRICAADLFHDHSNQWSDSVLFAGSKVRCRFRT